MKVPFLYFQYVNARDPMETPVDFRISTKDELVKSKMFLSLDDIIHILLQEVKLKKDEELNIQFISIKNLHTGYYELIHPYTRIYLKEYAQQRKMCFKVIIEQNPWLGLIQNLQVEQEE